MSILSIIFSVKAIIYFFYIIGLFALIYYALNIKKGNLTIYYQISAWLGLYGILAVILMAIDIYTLFA